MPTASTRTPARRPSVPVHYDIQTLGACGCSINGVRVTPAHWRSQRALELFLLIINSESLRITRASAGDLLWPDLLGDAANNNLRVALHRMRCALEPHRSSPTVVIADKHTIGLSFPTGSRVDSDDFRHAVAAARRCSDPRSALPLLRRACDAYTGHYLESFPLPEWAIPRRVQYTNDYVEAALRLGTQLLALRLYTELHERMWRLITLDPHNTAAHQLLQHAYAQSGNQPMVEHLTTQRTTLFAGPSSGGYHHALSS